MTAKNKGGRPPACALTWELSCPTMSGVNTVTEALHGNPPLGLKLSEVLNITVGETR
jgi:hypothetical protein